MGGLAGGLVVIVTGSVVGDVVCSDVSVMGSVVGSVVGDEMFSDVSVMGSVVGDIVGSVDIALLVAW